MALNVFVVIIFSYYSRTTVAYINKKMKSGKFYRRVIKMQKYIMTEIRLRASVLHILLLGVENYYRTGVVQTA